MKKTIVLTLITMLLIFTVVGTPILAKDPDKGSQAGPFKELWDAIDDIQSQIDNTETPILGAWHSREPYETYDADTDGFVVASLKPDIGGHCNTLWVEVWDPDGTLHQIVEQGELGSVLSITVPVPQGYSWMVSTGGFPFCNPTVYWVSLGN